MTPFRIEQTFRGTLERYWAVIFDPRYPESIRHAVGLRQFELLELTDHGDRITRTVRAEPERDLPAAVRKITGASLVYTEHVTLHKADHRLEFRVVLDKIPDRADISGQHLLSAPAEGEILRVCEGTVAVHVALIGKRIERSVAQDLCGTQQATAVVIQRWLDGAFDPA